MTTTAGRRIAAALTAALAALALAGCAGGSRSGSDQPGAQGTASAAPGQPVEKTSINRSSEDDLSATLRANGVSDPQMWAQTLIQFRPYPTDASGPERIREVLTQFQADPETTAAITNVVTP